MMKVERAVDFDDMSPNLALHLMRILIPAIRSNFNTNLNLTSTHLDWNSHICEKAVRKFKHLKLSQINRGRACLSLTLKDYGFGQKWRLYCPCIAGSKKRLSFACSDYKFK